MVDNRAVVSYSADLDLEGNRLINLVIHPSDTAPEAPEGGGLW